MEKEFGAAANLDMQDVCDYRLIPDADNYSVMAITKSLATFQDLVTTIFDAFKTSPKLRARISADAVAQSTLNFGYAYPGSLGFVLTMPNDRLLIGESELDKAFQTIFVMTKAQRPAEVASYVSQVGVAGIRRLFSWAKANVDYGLSTDIHWRRENEDRAHVMVQKEEMARLKALIDQASEEKSERVELEGELIGLDVGPSNSFRLRVPDAEDVVGRMSETFARSAVYEIHGRYRAWLIKRSKIHYSIDKEDEWWELVRLETFV